MDRKHREQAAPHTEAHGDTAALHRELLPGGRYGPGFIRGLRLNACCRKAPGTLLHRHRNRREMPFRRYAATRRVPGDCRITCMNKEGRTHSDARPRLASEQVSNRQKTDGLILFSILFRSEEHTSE